MVLQVNPHIFMTLNIHCFLHGKNSRVTLRTYEISVTNHKMALLIYHKDGMKEYAPSAEQ
jgi:hypothetical protein